MLNSQRVHIIGGAGSGKPTLAAEYAQRLELPHFELDDIMWQNVAERRPRAEAERDGRLQEIVDSERWVLDGIFWQKWVYPAFARADAIVLLNMPEWVRHYRVIKRHIQLLMDARSLRGRPESLH